jgi:integrase
MTFDLAPWRPETARAVRVHLVRAASLVTLMAGSAERVTALADIVTAEAFEFALRHLYERAGKQWQPNALNFATYLVTLARDHVHVDQYTLARLEKLRGIVLNRVRARRKPGLSSRVAELLRPFENRPLRRRFFKLPVDLYRRAKALKKDRPVRAAQLHEQGILIDFLQLDAMQRFNLASFKIEDIGPDETGQLRITVSGERVKNGINIDTPLPPALAGHYRDHLTIHRPRLRGSQSSWLFPSPTGHHRSPRNITDTIGKAVRRELGIKFTPHVMRHLLATLLYKKNPNYGVVVQRKLRHVSIKTTERMYGSMSNASSNDVWAGELEKERRNVIRKRRRPTPRKS